MTNISNNNNVIKTILQHIQNPGIFNASGIFKTMSISNMVRHFENPGIVRTVYSGIFTYLGTLDNI